MSFKDFTNRRVIGAVRGRPIQATTASQIVGIA